jgi:hypothetical protein
MTVDTTTEAVERLAQDVMKPDYLSPTWHTVAATLRALAGERDRLEKKRAAWARRALDGQRDVFEALRQRDAARAECVAMASQLTEARAQVARLREALWFYTMPENAPADVRDEWIKRMDSDRGKASRAALAEAPRHD